MKRTTIKDIAKLTSLSISTVSRALKNHPDISQKTKDRVQEVAIALDYSPNLNAQHLRTKSSKLIGLILPEVNQFFFPAMLDGVNKWVVENGYSLLLMQSDRSYLKEKQMVDLCFQFAVDGLLISLSAETENIEHLMKLKYANIPVVLLDEVLENEHFPCLTIDDRATAFSATEYLIENGHKDILGIFDLAELNMTRFRIEGFVEALKYHGLPADRERIITIPSNGDFEPQIEALLKHYPKATGIFAMSDVTMMNTYRVLTNGGWRIPEDKALIAISDGQAPYYCYPNITHLCHSGYEVGVRATELLFEQIQRIQPYKHFTRITTKLVKLGSV
ncbi:MAG: LacI family DNA-binding transcriptional regulator [Bacteroidota bacterium]